MKTSLLLFLIIAFSATCQSQDTEAIQEHFQKYFLALPYGKPVTDWLTEITNDQMVAVDTMHKEDSTNSIILRGYISDWPVFEKLDSVKFYVGKRISKQSFGINGSLASTGFETSLYLQEIFYFPYKTIDKTKWRETYQPVLKGFEKGLHAVRPTGGPRQGELVWFTTNSGLPLGGPMVSMEYGKIEKRNLYFITLILYFKT